MKKGLCVFLMLLSSVSYAAAKWGSADLFSIRSFTTQTENYVMVRNFSNPEACSNPNMMVILRDDSSNWKMLHSDLLAALMADKKVKIRVNGCYKGAHPIIDGVEIFR